MQTIRILLVEDLPSDAELARYEILKEIKDCTFRLVDTKESFLSALEEFKPDVIISDYMLPRFDGITALRFSLEHTPDTPFIILTGSMNEDTAVQCMKAGAWDYVIKEHIKRLGPAVNAVLEEGRVRIERKKAREALITSERKYHALFHDNKSIMILTDPETGRIVDANQSALEFYGYGWEELLGLSIHDIEVFEQDRNPGEMQPGFFHRHHRLSDGKVRNVEVYSGPITFEGKEVLYSIIHDVSDKMEYYREMETARHEAERANQVKGDFLANISHELRTPLNGVMGMLNVLEGLPLEQNARYWLSMARQAADNLYNIIVDILDFTQIEEQKLRPDRVIFSIDQFMEYLLLHFRKEAEEKGLEIQYKNSCTYPLFSGDRSRIAQVLWNILSNAVKYSDLGVIRVETLQEDGHIIFLVEDQGIGIEEKKLGDIFSPFQQLENPYTKTHRGVGLGLTIAHRLVELMEGTIRVKSKTGVGSRFEVTLPGTFSEERVEEAQSAEEEKSAALEEKKVLIVEDEAINRLYLTALLKKNGFAVFEAGNGRRAIEQTRENRPDIILMDIGLPVMDGLEATQHILKLPGCGSLPILALTAHAHPQDKERFLHGGMVEVINKPYQEAVLLEALERYL